MAEELAGRLFIELLPDVDKKKFQAAVNASVKGAEVAIPTTLKLTKTAVSDVVKDANLKLSKAKPKPSLEVNLRLSKGAASKAVKEANDHIALLKRKPTLNVGLSITAGEARSAIVEANKRLKAAKTAAPKLRVDLDLSTEKMELVRELRMKVKQIDVAFKGNPVEIPVDLDEKSIKAAGAKAVAAAAAVQAKIDTITKAGLDQRSLIEARALAQKQVIAARSAARLEQIEAASNARVSRGRQSSLRILRNDLSSFDASATRTIRRLSLLFTGFTAGVAASFAGITVAALRSFAETEVQVRRTAAVLGTEAFSAAAERGQNAYKAFRAEVEKVDSKLQDIVNTAALKTTFDPTETARGARALAQAGAEITDIQKSLLAISQFAQNEEILPEQAVQQLVQGATAAGMSIGEVQKLADKFTYVANDTTASAKEVADAFANRAAPAFRAYGQTIDQTLTVLDLFAAAGIKGKTAGEQAGILIREINKASTKTPKTVEAFKKYGIEVGRVNGVTVPFTKTLVQLGSLFERVRKQQGSQGLARLRKELGLTEKSGAGLIQILPQIADKGLSGLNKLTKQIEKPGDAVARQAEIITRTLSFQTEQFGNQVSALFKTAALPLGKGLTQIFLGLNGELKGTAGITDRLAGAFATAGKKIADSLLPSIKRFAFGGEGEAFLKGLVNLYRGTLIGLRQSFIEFRRAAFGDQDGRGFFSVLGSVFAAIGDFSQNTLPKIGRAFGVITNFVRENERLVKLLIATWTGTFIFSKTLRLAIVPASNLLGQMKGLKGAITGIAASKFGLWLLDSIRGMRALATATKSATAATTALAAAQAGTAATGTVGAAAGAGAAGTALGKTSTKAAGILLGTLASPLLFVGKIIDSVYLGFAKLFSFVNNIKNASGVFAGIRASIAGIVPALKSIGPALRPLLRIAGPIGLIVTAFEVVIGVVRGFVEEIKRSSTGSSEFANSLREIKPLIDLAVSSLKTLGTVVLNLVGVFVSLGESVGRFFAGALRDAVVILGDAVRIFRELANGNIGNALKALGDVIANSLLAPFKLLAGFFIDVVADIIGAVRNIPGIGGWARDAEASLRNTGASVRDFRVDLIGAADASDRTARSARNASRALGGIAFSAKSAQPVIYDTATGLFTLNSRLQQNNRGVRAWSNAFKNRMSETRTQTAVDAQGIKNEIFGITSVLNSSSEALKIQLAGDAATVRSYQRTFAQIRSGADISPADALERAALAGAAAEATANGLLAPLKKAVPAAKRVKKQVVDSLTINNDEAASVGDNAKQAAEHVKTAMEQAAEAVNKLSQVQLNQRAAALVARVSANAAKGYQATAIEAEILRRTLPALEAQLQRQQDAVAKLDKALQDLQSTQLKGTKAFSDQSFAIEQNIKKLQLQRLDLVIAGTPEQDSAILVIDEQISKLQQNAERLSLVESLQLDPLRRKLEQTFNPIKELTFGEIIKQFQSIQKQRAPLTDAIAGGENLKATLETTIKDAEARFGDAGRQVTAGFAVGIKGATPQVVLAGKQAGNAALTGVNNVMQFGSPSRTMIQRGVWVTEGFVVGINNGLGDVTSAGVSMMFGLLTGMRNVYTNRVQPFIRSIAEWIKNNKGPISYDMQLLRPAGEAMMTGFQRGLADGFKEVKGWVKMVGPELAQHTIPDKIFKKMSAEFLIGNASADLAFDPDDFFADISPLGMITGMIGGSIGQSTGLPDTIAQARLIAKMFGITPNIASELRRYNNPAYNAAIGGANNSLHVAGRAMDYTGRESSLDAASAWAKKYLGVAFDEVLWKTKGHYDHLHIGWMLGNKKLLADIGGASKVVEEALANASTRTGVGFNLLAAIAKAESGFNPNAVSGVGAGGLMQLMPGTARGLGVANVFDPKQNALGGAKYIKNLLDMFNGNIKLSLAGYNAGPANASIALKSFSETITYVERVMRYLKQFNSGNYRAQGGKVNAMTPYIVGERGRELFIPSQNGSVISNKDMRDLVDALRGAQQTGTVGAGTTINDNRKFEVISNSTDPATVAALVDARMRSQVVGVRR